MWGFGVRGQTDFDASQFGPELCLGLLCQKQAGLMVLACLITADTCDVVMLG